MEQLTEESAKRRLQLDMETTNTLTSQIELDKTAEEFRKAHQVGRRRSGVTNGVEDGGRPLALGAGHA
jgi:hypothetical protein